MKYNFTLSNKNLYDCYETSVTIGDQNEINIRAQFNCVKQLDPLKFHMQVFIEKPDTSMHGISIFDELYNILVDFIKQYNPTLILFSGKYSDDLEKNIQLANVYMSVINSHKSEFDTLNYSCNINIPENSDNIIPIFSIKKI